MYALTVVYRSPLQGIWGIFRACNVSDAGVLLPRMQGIAAGLVEKLCHKSRHIRISLLRRMRSSTSEVEDVDVAAVIL